MKKYFLFPLLLATFHWAAAQKFELVKCISGDCQNGKGVAEFTPPPNDYMMGTVTYNGNFKDGKKSGEGTITSRLYYYAGNFEDNYYRGYGMHFFTLKKVGNSMVPDTAHWIKFFKWDEDGCNISLTLEDNTTEVGRASTNPKHRKFWDSSPIKDEWIMQHMNAMKASPARPHIPKYEMNVITEKNIYAPKGNPVTLISWDCIAGRQYYVTEGVAHGKNVSMPFGARVDYQVTAEDGTVAFEGPVDNYWVPKKDGKYTFTIKFDQGEIIGNGNLYVKGADLSCSLRCRYLQ